jgi:hypothetical protein
MASDFKNLFYLTESNRHRAREIKLKKVAGTPDLTVKMTTGFGSNFKAEMSVTDKGYSQVRKLFSGFFFSPFHSNSHLLLDVVFTETSFPGMAHSLSLSAITVKKAVL